MKKENVVYTFNEILFRDKREGKPAICDNMNEPEGHYVRVKEAGHRKTHIAYLTCGV